MCIGFTIFHIVTGFSWALVHIYVLSAATLDIVLSLRAWRSLKITQILRYLLKFAFAAFWVVVMPVAYAKSVQDPGGVLRFFSNLGGYIENESLYYYCVAIYLIPEILAAFIFFFPFLRKSMERSNWRIISLLMWWAQVSIFMLWYLHGLCCHICLIDILYPA